MKKKLSVFEIVWYSITGALGLWGIVYMILGVITRHLKTTEGLYVADQTIAATFGLGFFWWGLILLGIAVFLAFIVLQVYATRADSKFEKESKRAARLQRAKNTNEIVDVEVK